MFKWVLILTTILFCSSCDDYDKEISAAKQKLAKDMPIRRMKKMNYVANSSSGELSGTFFLVYGGVSGKLTSEISSKTLITFSFLYENSFYITCTLPINLCRIKIINDPNVQPSISFSTDIRFNHTESYILNHLEQFIEHCTISIHEEYWLPYIDINNEDYQVIK